MGLISPLEPRQMLAITVSERFMSVLSILGSLVIMVSFISAKSFRKPINRLVFYATFGNIIAAIATLISTAALPNVGSLSPLCKFQAFLIQWFLLSDCLWVFCMALNVLLVFFRSYDSVQLRRLERYYWAFAYGLPGLPAITYLIIDHISSKKILGPATIWCWVSQDAEWMRLAFFYVPVWISISSTLAIYIVTGYKICKKSSFIRSFSRSTANERNSDEDLENPFRAGASNAIVRSTNIEVVRVPSRSHHSDAEESQNSSSSTAKDFSNSSHAPERAESNRDSRYSRAIEQNAASYKYGTAVLVSGPDMSRSFTLTRTLPPPRTQYNMEMSSAAWSYFKVAFLMFVSLFVVWVPSTVNRVHQFIWRGEPRFALSLASALVLPLQGFWNAMIYIATTWPELKRVSTGLSQHFPKFNSSRIVTSHNAAYQNSARMPMANRTHECEVPITLNEMPKAPHQTCHREP